MNAKKIINMQNEAAEAKKEKMKANENHAKVILDKVRAGFMKIA